jgi:hypothetical protein
MFQVCIKQCSSAVANRTRNYHMRVSCGENICRFSANANIPASDYEYFLIELWHTSRCELQAQRGKRHLGWDR